MQHITEIDITKRCGYKPTDTIFDFLIEMTDEMFIENMKEVISWKDSSKPFLKEYGLKAVDKYTPYLNSCIKDIPEDILNSYSSNWCTDGIKFYLYKPCCC